MGVYLNTFRTDHKTALYNGEPVKVYAFRFLCKAQDVDNWGNPWGRKSATLLRSQCEQAQARFDTHKPAFVISAGDKGDEWGGIVYANPTGACHYDTEALTKEPVGFLKQLPGKHANGGWVITGEQHGEDNPMYCGLTVRRAYVERVARGVPYSMTVKSYRFSNGTVFTPDQFEAWKVEAEKVYVANCQKAQAEREAKDAETARQVQAKRYAKNAEIQTARERVAQLEHERTLI